MRIIENWQYRYIEKSLYNYYSIRDSKLETETKIIQAIDKALEFFKNTSHETMLVEFYFNADEHRKKLNANNHFLNICKDIIHTEEQNGYVIRREIIYKIAMNCYSLNLFKI